MIKFFKMASILLLVLAVIACKTQAQLLQPRLPPLPPTIPSIPPICTTPPQIYTASPQIVTTSSQTPVVATTIVDNSVSNSLANALQLLIVSNLLENTMKPPCSSTLPSVTVVEPIPVPATVFSPTVDYFSSPIDFVTPYASCDIIEPIEIIPNIPIANIGCGCDVPAFAMTNIGVPTYGCGCDGFGPNFGLPNVGCGCDSYSKYGLPNYGCGCDSFGQKFGLQNFALPNLGCGCDACGSKFNLANICDACGPKFGVPNIAYDILTNTLGSRYSPCDGPIFAPMNSNCGCMSTLPVVEPRAYMESCGCPNKYGVYY